MGGAEPVGGAADEGRIAVRLSRARILGVGVVAMAAPFIAGCADFSSSSGMAPVARRASLDLGVDAVKIASASDAANARSRVQSLLTNPLSVESATQIALLNNSGLQAEYNVLGVSEADYVAATIPRFSFRGLFGQSPTDEAFAFAQAIAMSLHGLASYGKRYALARIEFEAAQLRAIDATFRTAVKARRAFYDALASNQVVGFLTRAQTAAEIAAELTRKQGETGAQTKLAQARAGAFYIEVSAELARARLDAERAREALIRTLGLWGEDIAFELPMALPPLPQIRDQPKVEQEAVVRRVDLASARLELAALATSLGIGEHPGSTSNFDLNGSSISASKDIDDPKAKDTDLVLEMDFPRLDLAATSSRRTEEEYQRAFHRLTELAVTVRSEAREAYIQYRGMHDIALLYQNRIAPLQKIIDEQILLEYNGMLVDVFDILSNIRESMINNITAINANRDFFLAAVDLEAAVNGGGVGSGRDGEGSQSAAGAADAGADH